MEEKKLLFSNRDLVNLIIPLIVEQLLAMLVGLADSIMIANVGESAVSGVSLVDGCIMLLINAFTALATGGAVVAGQWLGSEDRERASESAHQLIWFITILSVIVMGLVYFYSNALLFNVFGKITDEVRGYARIYLLIVAASIPFIALYNGGSAVFRAMGDSKTPMSISIKMNIINVVGNAILIYGFHFGAEGVAIPTLVSRMYAAFAVIFLLLNDKLTLHIKKTLKYIPNFNIIKKILYIGVPYGMENSMFQLGNIGIKSCIHLWYLCHSRKCSLQRTGRLSDTPRHGRGSGGNNGNFTLYRRKRLRTGTVLHQKASRLCMGGAFGIGVIDMAYFVARA